MTPMADPPYQILGDRTAPMRGRQKQMATLQRQLTKPTPDHVSLIGPKFIGKTVLLKHLARQMGGEGKPYFAAVYWDLRHGAPSTDAEFRVRLAQEIAAVLVPLRPDLEDEEPDYEWISAVLGILGEEGKRLLVILDGLDRILAEPGITRNFWDNLRALAQKPTLRLVTGSRRRLREICAGEDSRTSDFWEIFHDPPLTLGPFDAADWDDVLRPIHASRTMDASATKEVANWTGGVPVLVAALAIQLLDGDGKGPLTKADVDAAAKRVLSDSSVLHELWDDCDEELRGALVDIARAPLPLAQIPAGRRAALIGRGYAVESGAQIKMSCRLMESFATDKGAAVSDLRRLFADPKSYAKNVRALLELRLGQVQGAPSDVRGAVEKAVRELDANDPEASLVWFRPITERAFKAIWKAEMPSGKIPQAWKQAIPSLSADVPRSLGAQCGLLDKITGTSDADPVARYVSKPTYLLLNMLKGIGDFAHHRQDSATVTLGFAASTCLSAIELLDALARELPGGSA